jgi:hypothetical protein
VVYIFNEMIYKINDKHWHENIKLIVCPRDELARFIQKKHKERVSLPPSDGCYIDMDDVHYIWLNSFTHSIADMGLLIHELFHLVHKILKTKGFLLSSESEEAYTYYLQYLTVEFCEKLIPKTNGRTRKTKRVKKSK